MIVCVCEARASRIRKVYGKYVCVYNVCLHRLHTYAHPKEMNLCRSRIHALTCFTRSGTRHEDAQLRNAPQCTNAMLEKSSIYSNLLVILNKICTRLPDLSILTKKKK